jgi:hypothetical protein
MYGKLHVKLVKKKYLKLLGRLNARISGSHGGEYEDGCLLGCSAV